MPTTTAIPPLLYGKPVIGYAEALREVDTAVNEIVTAPGSSGLESKTAIILSSDHLARLISKLTPYAPFIVNLPGYDAGIISDQEFSTLGTGDLVLAIARGEIRSPQNIYNFLMHAR